jgi:membrane protein
MGTAPALARSLLGRAATPPGIPSMIKLNNNQAWSLVTRTVGSWRRDHVQSMGAALAFYAVFSVAPLLLFAIALAGYFFGPAAAKGEIMSQMAGLVGNESAHAIQALVASASEQPRHSIAASIGIVVFIVAATSVFNELQDSLNRIWQVHGARHKAGFFAFVRARLLSLGMILGISLLLLVSVVVSAGLSSMTKALGPTSMRWQFAAQLTDVFLSFALITVMFAVIFKVIPHARLRWGDTWTGAATTAVFFTIGKQLIGIYLGRRVVMSGYGTVGSLAVFLLWVYYSAQIFLLGAEFTSIYSNTRGKGDDADGGD